MKWATTSDVTKVKTKDTQITRQPCGNEWVKVTAPFLSFPFLSLFNRGRCPYTLTPPSNPFFLLFWGTSTFLFLVILKNKKKPIKLRFTYSLLRQGEVVQRQDIKGNICMDWGNEVQQGDCLNKTSSYPLQKKKTKTIN